MSLDVYLHAFLLGIYLEKGHRTHMFSFIKYFSKVAVQICVKYFSNIVVQIYAPTSNVRDLFQVVTNTYYSGGCSGMCM